MLCPLLLAWSLLAAAAADRDPAQVLQRVSVKVRVRAASLPNYTCVETVSRDYYKPKAALLERSCPVVSEDRQHPSEDMALRLIMTDRLRLDVTLTSQGEIYSWVGASKFEDSGIEQIVHQGPIATGSFGALLAIVFGQDPKAFHFERETVVAGRDVMEYSYQTAQENSRYKVKTKDGWVYTAYSGTFQVDPETDEVLRMTVQTAELPPSTGSCRTTTTMEFARVHIGDGQFLLPTAGRQRFIDRQGEEVENTTTFSACREYRGESTITFFPAPEIPAGKAPQTASSPAQVPAGLPFTFELTTPISASTAAGGDSFTGRLVSALRDKDRKIIAPAHAVVEGRLLQVENRHIAPLSALLVLKLRSIQIGGVPVPFAADRDTRRVVGGRVVKAPILMPFTWEEHAGLFQFPGDGAVMKAGSRSDWVTAAQGM